VWANFFALIQTGPGAHPASCTMGTEFFPGVNSGQGVTLTSHLRLLPWSRKSRAIPLLPLWAVRPVRGLSACTRVHFTLYHIKTQKIFCERNLLNTYRCILFPNEKRREYKAPYFMSDIIFPNVLERPRKLKERTLSVSVVTMVSKYLNDFQNINKNY
jgi:hypothetical protein